MNIHDHTFDAKTEAVIEKVRKLMALAEGNDNEHQAEAASAKARELLESYNLDIAILNKASKSFAPRDDQKLRGGLYGWQRDLWNMTATLNFCKYYFIRGLKAGSSYEHRLIGSKANVISTTIMAQYLQDTIERLAREWVHTNRPGKSVFIKEAVAFREGVSSRLVNRMWRMREDRLKEERLKQEAERKANAEQGIFTENALVLADVISTEEDLNNDHIFGWEPGTSARRRHEEKLRQEAAQRDVDALLKQQAEWDAEHPEEAAKRKAKERAEYEEQMRRIDEKLKNKKPRYRRMTPEEERRSMASFRTGYNKGDEISLDKQVDVNKTRRLE